MHYYHFIGFHSPHPHHCPTPASHFHLFLCGTVIVNTQCMPMIMSEKSYCVWMCYLTGLDSVVSISANRFNLNFGSSDSPALWVQSSLCMPFAEFLLVCLLKTQIFLVWSPAKFLLFVYCVCMCVTVFLFLLQVLFFPANLLHSVSLSLLGG